LIVYLVLEVQFFMRPETEYDRAWRAKLDEASQLLAAQRAVLPILLSRMPVNERQLG
jgi:hypothetical protein